MNNNIEENDIIRLKIDLPAYNLYKGARGTVVHVYEGYSVYEVEFPNGKILSLGANSHLEPVDKSVIPKGIYCYDENGNCPYHSIQKDLPKMENGYCSYLRKSDVDLGVGLLWDQVKECGINIDDGEDL